MSDLERELRRVLDRLGSLTPERLGQPAAPWPSRAVAARDTAQVLADLAQGVEERRAERPPAARAMPALTDRAAPDQLAVAAYDLLGALRAAPPGTPVWVGETRLPVEEGVRRAVAALAALRRAL